MLPLPAGPLMESEGWKQELGLQSFPLMLRSAHSSGETAICQRPAVPMGTALNKTKQHEEAATRQHWLLAQRFHVPPRSHRLMCSCRPGTT